MKCKVREVLADSVYGDVEPAVLHTFFANLRASKGEEPNGKERNTDTRT